MISELTLRWGMHSLNVAFNREPSHDTATLYKAALEDLTDETFRAAVRDVIREERFFPPPAVIRDYAERIAASNVLLLPPARSEEQKATDREATRRGLEIVRAALKERGIDLGVKEMP